MEGAIYTFGNVSKMPTDIDKHLVEGEEAKYCYKSVRDMIVFTDKRIIISNTKGTTGKTAELISIPYSSICFYSTENAGTFIDAYCILRLWTKCTKFEINLSSQEKIGNIAKLLDSYLIK